MRAAHKRLSATATGGGGVPDLCVQEGVVVGSRRNGGKLKEDSEKNGGCW